MPKGPAPIHAAPVAVAHHSHWDVPAYAPWNHHVGAPLPVQKTPEVVAAEHAHFAAVAEAKARLHHHHKRSAVGPVDTPEVQLEKQIHFAAHQRALQGLPANPILYHPQLAQNNHHYAPAPAPVHYNKWSNHHDIAPAPVNGVPQDTAEVAHAKQAHLALVAHAKAHAAPAHYAHAPAAPAYHDAHAPSWKAYSGPLHYPVIHNGVPEETAEVKAEKAKHFSLVAQAQSHSAPYYAGNGHEDDGSYDPRRYENEGQYY